MRNHAVEKAVDGAINDIDCFLSGKELSNIPDKDNREIIDAQLSHTSYSVRLASLFFIYYAMHDLDWNKQDIPKGIRGKFGDKRIATELTQRDITLHNAITAFGENLGWKGNVNLANLQTDPKFSALVSMLKTLSSEAIAKAAEYTAWRFAESQRSVAPLPPLPSNYLTFARARQLFYRLARLNTGGNVQQFLVAAILQEHYGRVGQTVKTHNVNAADKYDRVAGDVEVYDSDNLVAAYEISARPDWKNRIPDFTAKMHSFKLNKYGLIVTDVYNDTDLASPESMLEFLDPYRQDIAIVDLDAFLDFMAMELNAKQLQQAINTTFALLKNRKLCGRTDIIEEYKKVVDDWLG